MEPKLLIGLTGPARSGKDTVAGFLRDRGFRSMSFAGPLRAFVSSITGLTIEQLTDGELKERPIPAFGNRSPRYMMQTLGTEWGRELVDKDLWLNVAMAKVDATRNIPTVVTDVRFENEAAAIRARGGVIWHIERPGAQKVNAHVSESGVKQKLHDYYLLNKGSIEDLGRTVGHLVELCVGSPE